MFEKTKNNHHASKITDPNSAHDATTEPLYSTKNVKTLLSVAREYATAQEEEKYFKLRVKEYNPE